MNVTVWCDRRVWLSRNTQVYSHDVLLHHWTTASHCFRHNPLTIPYSDHIVCWPVFVIITFVGIHGFSMAPIVIHNSLALNVSTKSWLHLYVHRSVLINSLGHAFGLHHISLIYDSVNNIQKMNLLISLLSEWYQNLFCHYNTTLFNIPIRLIGFFET